MLGLGIAHEHLTFTGIPNTLYLAEFATN